MSPASISFRRWPKSSPERRVLILVLVLSGAVAAFRYIAPLVPFGSTNHDEDRARMLEQLRAMGIAKWVDAGLADAYIGETFTGEASRYCRLRVPPTDVKALLSALHTEYPLVRRYTAAGRDFGMPLKGHDWWDPQLEARVTVLEFRPLNTHSPAHRWAIAASEASGKVYFWRIGH